MYIKKMQKISPLLIAVAAMTLLSAPAAASDSGNSWWDTIKDAGSDLVDTVKEKGPGWVDTAKEKGSAALDKAKDGVNAASGAISEFNQGQQDQFFDWFDQQTHPSASSSDGSNSGATTPEGPLPPEVIESPEVVGSAKPDDVYYYNPDQQSPTTVIDNSQTYNYYDNSTTVQSTETINKGLSPLNLLIVVAIVILALIAFPACCGILVGLWRKSAYEREREELQAENDELRERYRALGMDEYGNPLPPSSKP